MREHGFFAADSIAALMVAVIVFTVCFRLGKRSIDVLLDAAPGGVESVIEKILEKTPEVNFFHDIRVRNAGPDTFVEINIHVNPKMSIEQAHEVAEKVECKIKEEIERCVVHIHQEPEEK